MVSIRLTPAQERVLPLVAEGLSYSLIADRLGLSVETVKKRVYVIAQKLGPSPYPIAPYAKVMLWVHRFALPTELPGESRSYPLVPHRAIDRA